MGEAKFIVSVYVMHQQEVLLVNHVKQQAWAPIGGKLLPGETPLEAAKRETFEEIGLRSIDYSFNQQKARGADAVLGMGNVPGLILYEEHMAAQGEVHLCFSFLIKTNSKVITPCPEYTEVKWVHVFNDNLPMPCPPNVQYVLRHVAFQSAGKMANEPW